MWYVDSRRKDQTQVTDPQLIIRKLPFKKGDYFIFIFGSAHF